jgi:hypothetical protein
MILSLQPIGVKDPAQDQNYLQLFVQILKILIDNYKKLFWNPLDRISDWTCQLLYG